VLTDHAWNPDGTLATRDDGGSGNHAFSYDWADRLTTVSSPFFAGQVTSAWRNDGLLASRQWPAGAGGAATFSYDAALRPVEMDKAGDAAASFAQTYDRDGNVTSESRSLTGVTGDAGDGTQTFTYDGLNRVVSAAGLDQSQGFVYDHDSNRVAVATGTGSVSYAYDRSGQLLSLDDEGHDPELFAYDAWGNLTTSATDFDTLTAYAYDAADRLTGITQPDATQTTFAFDALGRHASSTTGSVETTIAYLGTSETAWQLDDGTTTVNATLDADGSRMAIEADGTDGFSLVDLHGNTAAAVNAADDTILSAVRYDAYGQTADSHDSGGGFSRPWGFQGRLDLSADPANPLYEFSARFYAPVLGAFTQLDSYAGDAASVLSLNRYLYAGANPWTLIDPSGHAFEAGAGGSGCRAPCTSSPAPQKSTVGGANRRGTSGSAGEGINRNEDVWSWHLSDPEQRGCTTCRTPDAQTRWDRSLDIAIDGTRMLSETVALMRALRESVSNAGRVLRSGGEAASGASEVLRRLSPLTKNLGPGVAVASKGLVVVSGVLDFASEMASGESAESAAVHATLTTGGSLGGAFAAGVACSLTPATIVGAAVCGAGAIVLPWIGGTAGGWIADQVNYGGGGGSSF
jgi:RHS repeat-associated protein